MVSNTVIFERYCIPELVAATVDMPHKLAVYLLWPLYP